MIGIIWMLLIVSGYVLVIVDVLLVWVIGVCYLLMGFGMLFGGWCIVWMMG